MSHHSHAHHHHGHHAHAHNRHDRVFLIGISLNLAYVVVEAYFGWKIDSLALLADAGHNLSDVAALFLAWAAAWAAQIKPDARHTYGFKRAGLLAALINSVLLLVAMGSLIWEAIQRLGAPPSVDGVVLMWVAGLGMLVNAFTAALFVQGAQGDLNLRGAFLHMAADAMVSAGVVIAGAVSLWWAVPGLDPIVSMVIAAIIVWGTVALLRQSIHRLFDGVPEHIDLLAVSDVLRGQPGVIRIHDLHIWSMSTTDSALSAHLVMADLPKDDTFLINADQALRTQFGIAHITLQLVQQPFTPPCSELA